MARTQGAREKRIDLGRLVSRLHLELIFRDGLIEFAFMLCVCCCFCVTLYLLRMPDLKNANQVVRGIPPLHAGVDGKFTLETENVVGFMKQLARVSEDMNPLSAKFSSQVGRLLVGPMTAFSEEMKLKSGSTFILNSEFTLTAWLRYSGNGNQAQILRKVKVSDEGEVSTCWAWDAYPLRLTYRTLEDVAYAEWGASESHSHISQDSTYFEASEQFFQAALGNDTLAAELDEHLRLASTEGDGFHFVAMVYSYDVHARSATVKFGIDGAPLVDIASPAGRHPFPVTDCAEGELLIGDMDLEIADLIWMPWSLSDSDFQNLYTGLLRPAVAPTVADELEPSAGFQAAAHELRSKFNQQARASTIAQAEWVGRADAQLRGDLAGSFRASDHRCSAPVCEVRVHPLGEWYSSALAQASHVSVVAAGTPCDATSPAVSASVDPPVTSTRPASAAGAVLDRYTLAAPGQAGEYSLCWHAGPYHRLVGALRVEAGPVDFQELIGDASWTFREGHVAEPLSEHVGADSAFTVAFFVRHDPGASGFDYLFVKTATQTAASVADNAIWALVSYGGEHDPYFWKDIYADGEMFAKGKPFVRGHCIGAVDVSLRMHHVAFVVDSAEQRGGLYVDGELCVALTVKDGLDSARVFEDAVGNITIASGRFNPYEFIGEMKQFRYYNRSLSAAELRALAADHRECRPIDEMIDDVNWRDESTRNCMDYFDARKRAALPCSVQAQERCPVACAEVAKCYESQASLPDHILPRDSWTTSSRTCLRSGSDASDVLQRCRGLSQEQRQREYDADKPWAWDRKSVQSGEVFCQRMQEKLRGSDSCPLDLDAFERLYNAGDGWTLLWRGGALEMYCDLLAPTKTKAFLMDWAGLLKNATSGDRIDLAPPTSRGGSSVRQGWKALAASRSRNKLLYFVDGAVEERPFEELDRCAVEAVTFSRPVANLRVLPGFSSGGQLTRMYYEETFSIRKGAGFRPVQNDMVQFGSRSQATFEPYMKSLLNVMPPIVFYVRAESQRQDSCPFFTQSVYSMVDRRMRDTAQCHRGCEETHPVTLRCLGDKPAASARGANAEFFNGFRGQDGDVFDLSKLQQVVTRSGDKLRSSEEIVQDQVKRGAKRIYIIFSFWVKEESVVKTIVQMDLDTSTVQGSITHVAYMQPQGGFHGSVGLTMALALLLFAYHARKFFIVRRRRRLLCRFPPEVQFQNLSLRNAEDLHEDWSCKDPIARESTGNTGRPMSAAAALLTLVSLPLQVSCTHYLDTQLRAKFTDMTSGEYSLLQRMGVVKALDESFLWNNNSASLLVFTGLVQVIAIICLFTFHLRTAIVVRSLIDSASPLSHFLLIFVLTGALLSYFMYMRLAAVHEGYSDTGVTMNTQVDFILGLDRPQTDVGDTASNTFMHFFVTVFFMMVLVNVFLAIIMDAYSRQVEEVEQIEEEYSIFYDLWLFFWQKRRFQWRPQKKWVMAYIIMQSEDEEKSVGSSEEMARIVAACPKVETVAAAGNASEQYVFSDELYGTCTFTTEDVRNFFQTYINLGSVVAKEEFGKAALKRDETDLLAAMASLQSAAAASGGPTPEGEGSALGSARRVALGDVDTSVQL